MLTDDTYYCSDTHFGDEKKALARGYESAKDFADSYIKIYNSVVTTDDVVVIAGDVARNKTWTQEILSQLNGNIFITLGNHDHASFFRLPVRHSICVFSGRAKLLVTHIPVHPLELEEGWLNLHGHLHKSTIPDARYINLCPEHQGLAPRKFKNLVRTHAEFVK